jgi:hypothetical protein
LNRSSHRFRVTISFAAVAIILGGCAAANNAASNEGEQRYRTAYGIPSEGMTTDLYTELFGSRKPAATPATATTAQEQPATASTAPQPAQPAITSASTPQGQPKTATAAARQAQPAMASSTPRQVQPAPAEVAQQPPPEPEPDIPVAYGITAKGPTTDLYTELFGPRRRDGQ